MSQLLFCPQAEIDREVAILLQLKAKYKEVTGQDVGGAGVRGKGKEKQVRGASSGDKVEKPKKEGKKKSDQAGPSAPERGGASGQSAHIQHKHKTR